MQVDDLIEIERIRNFSAQWKLLSVKEQDTIKAQFKGIQNMDYYTGLLVGLAASYQIAKQAFPGAEVPIKPDEMLRFIGGSLAYVAKLIQDKIE